VDFVAEPEFILHNNLGLEGSGHSEFPERSDFPRKIDQSGLWEKITPEFSRRKSNILKLNFISRVRFKP
jgi:hypothetical protein